MSRRIKSLYFALALGATLIVSPSVCTAEADFVKEFAKAHDEHLILKMNAIIEKHKDAVMGEIDALLKNALLPKTTVKDAEGNLYVSELMARTYKDMTGNLEPLKRVKRQAFDSRLAASVVSEAKKGVHTVEFPLNAAGTNNVFSPDNIVIRDDETVRWVNNDNEAHVFATMRLTSTGYFKAPSIPPGESWEYKFDTPGAYYLICYIHRGMIGKVTVLGEGEDPSSAVKTDVASEPSASGPAAAAPEAASGPEAASDAPKTEAASDDTVENVKKKKKKKKRWWKK